MFKFIICIIILILVFFLSVAIWAKKKLNDGICPLCVIKQHLRKSHITINVPDEFYNNGAVETPPMGWSSWNTFKNHIDESLILETADALVKTGLSDAGYKFVNLDDCWQSSMRTENGELQGDFGRFPSGIASLVKKINEKGLKAGIYSSNGKYTCEDLPGSLGHEKTDAKTFAEWGIEYFKYDYCHEKEIPSAAPFVEKIEINASTGIITLPATDAKLFGLAKMREDKKLKSGHYLCFFGQGKGSAEFDFSSEKDELCSMTVAIKKCGKYEKYLVIKINDNFYEMFFPPTSAWNVDGRYQIKIKIQKGNNKVKIFNPVCTRADSTYIQYKRMGEELKNASNDRKIVYSICEHGKNNPKDWAWNAGNLWRTTPDIIPNQKWINLIYNRNLKLHEKAGNGHWNDPDMLEVGNGKLTYDENKSHFTLWCMMSAPLILGNDVRMLLNGSDKSEKILGIIKNPELIAINQDVLGCQCIRYKKTGDFDFLVKKMSGDRAAVCIYNRKRHDKTVRFSLSELPNEFKFGAQKITEIWTGKVYDPEDLNITISAHGCTVFILN